MPYLSRTWLTVSVPVGSAGPGMRCLNRIQRTMLTVKGLPVELVSPSPLSHRTISSSSYFSAIVRILATKVSRRFKSEVQQCSIDTITVRDGPALATTTNQDYRARSSPRMPWPGLCAGNQAIVVGLFITAFCQVSIVAGPLDPSAPLRSNRFVARLQVVSASSANLSRSAVLERRCARRRWKYAVGATPFI